MKHIYAFILLICIMTLTACNLTYENEEFELVLDGKGLENIAFNLTKGDVEIVGEDRDDILVIAELATASKASEEAVIFREEHMTVTLEEKDATTAQIKTEINYHKDESIQARIHLQVFVPNHLALNIRQDSGELYIRELNNQVEINQGLGPIIVENMMGDMRITDGAGDIIIRKVLGNLTLNNSSGLVTISELEGDMKITGGSGSVDIQETQGNIEIISGSGNIKVDSVLGDVKIIENRSGKLEITNVNGQVIQ